MLKFLSLLNIVCKNIEQNEKLGHLCKKMYLTMLSSLKINLLPSKICFLTSSEVLLIKFIQTRLDCVFLNT